MYNQIEIEKKVCIDFTITENAAARAFFWLKAANTVLYEETS